MLLIQYLGILFLVLTCILLCFIDNNFFNLVLTGEVLVIFFFCLCLFGASFYNILFLVGISLIVLILASLDLILAMLILAL